MTKETITEPVTKPMTDEVPPSWPPIAHIIRNEDRPAKEGTIAICGTKLMGIDLGRLNEVSGKVCEKCTEVLRKELERDNG
jgi:hypothetical protein